MKRKYSYEYEKEELKRRCLSNKNFKYEMNNEAKDNNWTCKQIIEEKCNLESERIGIVITHIDDLDDYRLWKVLEKMTFLKEINLRVDYPVKYTFSDRIGDVFDVRESEFVGKPEKELFYEKGKCDRTLTNVAISNEIFKYFSMIHNSILQYLFFLRYPLLKKEYNHKEFKKDLEVNDILSMGVEDYLFNLILYMQEYNYLNNSKKFGMLDLKEEQKQIFECVATKRQEDVIIKILTDIYIKIQKWFFSKIEIEQTKTNDEKNYYFERNKVYVFENLKNYGINLKMVKTKNENVKVNIDFKGVEMFELCKFRKFSSLDPSCFTSTNVIEPTNQELLTKPWLINHWKVIKQLLNFFNIFGVGGWNLSCAYEKNKLFSTKDKEVEKQMELIGESESKTFVGHSKLGLEEFSDITVCFK